MLLFRKKNVFLCILLLSFPLVGLAQVKKPSEPKPAPVKKKTSVQSKKQELPLAGNSGIVIIIDSPGDLYVNGLYIGHYNSGESWQYKIIAGKHIIKLDNGIDEAYETSVVCQPNMQSTHTTRLSSRVEARLKAEEQARILEEKRRKEEEKRRREEEERQRIAEEKRQKELEEKERRIREYEARKKEEARLKAIQDSITEAKRKQEEEYRRKARQARLERINGLKKRGAKDPEVVHSFITSFTYVKSGTLKQGCTEDQIVHCQADERPSKSVEVSGFFINKFEVTQELWMAVMDTNYSKNNSCKLCPVENVSFGQVQEFIKKLNFITEGNYRLPTEAEWEYAARGGHRAESVKPGLASVSWFSQNSGGSTHEVGTLDPNELGIYDMYGNVWEYCSDWYDANYYKSVVQTNPLGPDSGSERVIRGGSYFSIASECRAANRNKIHPLIAHHSYGFRLVTSNSANP